MPIFRRSDQKNHWQEKQWQHRATPQQFGNASTSFANQAEPERVLTIYCKAHGRQLCAVCFSSTPIVKHTCYALLATQVELKCGCSLPVLAEACSAIEGRPDLHYL